MPGKTFNLQALTVAVLTTCLLCTACTTTRQVSLSPVPSSSKLSPEPGRKAVIELRSGEHLSGTIAGIDDRGLTLRLQSGSIRGVAFEDMQSMKISRFSWGLTAAAVSGAILAAGAAFIIALHRAEMHEE